MYNNNSNDASISRTTTFAQWEHYNRLQEVHNNVFKSFQTSDNSKHAVGSLKINIKKPIYWQDTKNQDTFIKASISHLLFIRISKRHKFLGDYCNG